MLVLTLLTAMDNKIEQEVANRPLSPSRTTDTGAVVQFPQQLRRSLSNRQIQLIGIGGAIGTALCTV